jgi:hypothetical protein
LGALGEFAQYYEDFVSDQIAQNEALANSLNNVIEAQTNMTGNTNPETPPPSPDGNDGENSTPEEENPYGKASAEGSSKKSIQWAL